MKDIPQRMPAGPAATTILSLLVVLMPRAGAGLFKINISAMAPMMSLIWLARQDLAKRMEQA